jgi:hypothetical protein
LIQNQLNCCGLDAFNKTAPVGVNPNLVSGLAGQPCPTVLYADDKKATCMQPMVDQISSSYVTVGVVAVVFAFIQVRFSLGHMVTGLYVWTHHVCSLSPLATCLCFCLTFDRIFWSSSSAFCLLRLGRSLALPLPCA